MSFGRSLRALRIRRRWTQDELGRRSGVSRGVVARIEQGRASHVPIATLDRVTGPLGARVLVKLLWQGEGLERLLDGRHASVVDVVVRVLRAASWTVATEVSFNEYGERGSIDVFAFHPETRTLLVVEVKTVIGDAGALQSTLDRKVRLAPKLAHDRGWPVAGVGKLLVIVDSRTNRRQVARLAETFDAAFPIRSIGARRWLATPRPREPLRGLWFVTSGREAVVVRRVRVGRVRSTLRSDEHS
ncbi:MAG TPA: helix-turn-helix domain-containing protein [Candidatus Limnocylindrales bacterium]|nr:helix-turn-helix domain-containing protein [Candidatus Limnocylindrales bacterium]